MISREFEARLKRTMGQDVDLPVQIELNWDPEIDPLAVQAIIQVEDEEDVVWHFARDLLVQGCSTLFPCGGGDVKFRYQYNQGVILMCLRNLTGHADLALPAGEVMAFVKETLAIQKLGEEVVDTLLDEAIEEMLGGS